MIQKIEADKADSTASLLEICIETGVSARWLARGEGEMHQSQPMGFDDRTMSQAVELLNLMADARPDDKRFQRPTWAMIRIGAKALSKAEGAGQGAMSEILAELTKET